MKQKSAGIVCRFVIPVWIGLLGVNAVYAQTGSPALEARIDSLKQVYVDKGVVDSIAEKRARMIVESEWFKGKAPADKILDTPDGSIMVNRDPTYASYTPTQLVENIFVKSGACSSVSNVVLKSHGWNGTIWTHPDSRGLGYFSKNNSNFEMSEGLVLSTGALLSIEGPNASSDGVGDPLGTAPMGDPDLKLLAKDVRNYSALEFDFVPTASEITFRYVFASEEYLQYANTEFNDVFGFFIYELSNPSGKQNIAQLPTSSTGNYDVSINNVNWGNVDYPVHNTATPLTAGAKNPGYYKNIPGSFAPPPPFGGASYDSLKKSMQFNGRTVVLTATYQVNPCSSYHLKLAVGNCSDKNVQSGVFLEAHSLDLGELLKNSGSMNDGQEYVYRGCAVNKFTVFRLQADPTPLVVYLTYGGTALSDIALPGGGALPATVTIPANELSVDVFYEVKTLNLGTGHGTFTITTTCPCGGGGLGFTKTIDIYDPSDPDDFQAVATPACLGTNNGTITVSCGTGGSGTYESSIDGGITWQSFTLDYKYTELASADYSVFIRDMGGCTYETRNVSTFFSTFLAPTISGTFDICAPASSTTLTASAGGDSCQWYKDGSPIAGATSFVYTATASGNYYVIAFAGGCNSDFSDTVTVRIHGIVPDAAVTNLALTYWQYETAPSLLSATGATAITDHTLKWYQSDGTTLYTNAANPINTAVAGVYDYYVSQINDAASCESNKILVSVIVAKPQVLNYIACPDAVVTLGLDAIPGVSFYWYSAQSGGTLLTATSSDTYMVTKDAATLQTFWIEPRTSVTTYTRIPVNLSLSESCGGAPVTCTQTGTLLFREDFGGNSPSDPNPKPTGIPQMDPIYTYTTLPAGMTNERYYTINKSSFPHVGSGDWYEIDDHTYSGDATRGYMLQVNASAEKGQFYEHRLDGLCPGTKLYFSAWLVSLMNQSLSDKVNQIFTLEDNSGRIIVQYTSGALPDISPTWKQYGFEFTVPPGLTALTLRVINNSTGSMGNDFAMDDIEVHFCTPPVAINSSVDLTNSVCLDTPITLTGTYADDGTFGSSLDYRWEYSLTGNINNPAEWTVLTASSGASPLDIDFNIPVPTAAGTVFYRLVIADAANMDNPMCRAASNILSVNFQNRPSFSTIAAATCSDALNLYAYVENLQNTVSDSLKFSTENSFTTGVITNPENYIFTGITTIYVVATNGGCSSPVQTMTIQPGVLGLSAPNEKLKNVSCFGGSDGSALARPLNGSAPYTYAWNTSPPQSDSIALNLSKGTYSCTVSDVVGCTGTINVTLTEPPLLSIQGITTTNTYCNEAFGACEIQVTGGTPPYTYSLDGGVVYHTTNNHSNLLPGNYPVVVKDNNDCETVPSDMTITSQPLQISISTTNTICKIEGMILDPGSFPLPYLWHDGSTSQTCQVRDTGWYWVKVAQSPTCEAYDSVYIESCDVNLLIPNAFTPNSDGLNDTFHVVCNEKARSLIPENGFHLQIFNKSGQMIFRSSNLDVHWDGKYMGKVCPKGVYSYVIKYVDSFSGQSKTIRGTVLLLD